MTPQQRAAALRLANALLSLQGRKSSKSACEAAALLRELAQEPQAEPVGYMPQKGLENLRSGVGPIGVWPAANPGDVPLYANPPQQRHLSNEQVSAFVAQVQGPPWLTVEQLIRAIEAAHGIVEKP